MSTLARHWRLALLAAAALCIAPAAAQSLYQKDFEFAIENVERECGALIRQKKIDWQAVHKELAPEAKSVSTDQQHLLLLTRLLARLQDGHARVTQTEKTKEVRWPDEPARVGCGMFWCRSGKKILVKTVWSAAKDVGLEPGSQLIAVDGVPVDKWLDARIATLREFDSFSTAQHAFFRATHQGLAMPVGTRLELELQDPDGKPKQRTITYSKGSYLPMGPALMPEGLESTMGPALMPEGLESTEDVNYGMLDRDTAYVHIRRCPETLPAQVDTALAKLVGAKCMVLDFRGNSGGGFDHEGFMGRFVPRDTVRHGQLEYPSRGEHPFGGPIVVIVDGTVISAGETASGIFKEDGRAYMIGESPTAGMSSQKTTIELPSGLFGLYVSTHTNKKAFNGGRGIEGIGVIPHETIALEAKDLAKGVDTLIRRAREILAKFPKEKVPYKAP